MSSTLRALRRAAGVTSLAVASCALTLPFAAPAHAVTPVERAWTVADHDGDLSYGLWYTDLPGGTPTKVDETAAGDISQLSASGDGTRIVYIKDTYSGVSGTEQVIVRDISGRVVRVLTSMSMDSGFVEQPRLSPDGKTAIWTQYGSTGFSVKKVLVGTGSPVTLASGRFGTTFLDNSTVLTQSTSNGTYVAVPLAGGSASISGLPLSADEVEVSPNHDKIAWYEDTTPDGSNISTGAVHVAALANSSGAWTVSGDSVLSSTLDNLEPSFSRDGLSVYWAKWDGDSGVGDILVRPVDGSTPATTLTNADDEFDVAITSIPGGDTTVPTAAGDTAYTINGVTPVVRWTLPDDLDLSGVLVSRYAHGSATPQRNRSYLPAPLTSFTDSGLVLGQTYDYKIETVDRSGQIGTAVTRSLTAIKPGPVFGSPTSAKSTKTSFPVAFAAGALSTTTFWVDYVPAGSSTWTHWVNGATGSSRTFGAAAATNVLATTATAGQSYGFHVKVQDAYGNASGYVNGTDKAVVPYDQTKATLYGGTNVTSTSAYLGSYRRLTTTSQYAKVTLVGNRLQVVGWKCSGCGTFYLYDGSTKIATVSTYSASTVARTVLYTRSYTASGTHTFTIKPAGTAGHPAILLDGFAMRR